MNTKEMLESGNTFLGIELGSTRIKAVLIGADYRLLATGIFDWQNQLVNGLWTYDLADARKGLRAAYRNLAEQVQKTYGVAIRIVGAIGISGMMHGFLPFDEQGRQLADFATWRNTVTEREAAELTALFGVNIPQRWSIAHLYKAVLQQNETAGRISELTTLAGYIHRLLTGKKVIGIGEASGMFPIDTATLDYDAEMCEKFDTILARNGIGYHLTDILPQVLTAGTNAGYLTEEGAALLDETGVLQSGIPFCPPEGDAGTGMVATDSIAAQTGNISAGTSIFAMMVLDQPLKKLHTEVDTVTTPDGKPVAMVHCNTCTSDLDAWVKLFDEVLKLAGCECEKSSLYGMLYRSALTGTVDCGGMVAYNYYAGEPVVGMPNGCPMFARDPGRPVGIADFMRTQIFSAIATLKIGMDTLFSSENIQIRRMLGHGGFFKTQGVAQKFMASALGFPICVNESAGEGGAFGMALLAAFSQKSGMTLDAFLEGEVFADVQQNTEVPEKEYAESFNVFLNRYKACIPAQKIVGDVLNSAQTEE